MLHSKKNIIKQRDIRLGNTAESAHVYYGGNRTLMQFTQGQSARIMFSRQVMPDSCSPVDCSPPGSSVWGISRQEYWSGLPFPSPGIKPGSPAWQEDSLPLSHLGSLEARYDPKARWPTQCLKIELFAILFKIGRFFLKITRFGSIFLVMRNG